MKEENDDTVDISNNHDNISNNSNCNDDNNTDDTNIDIFNIRSRNNKNELPEHQIFVFDDVLDISLCDELIEVIEEYAVEKDKWRDGNNVMCHPINLEQLPRELYIKYDKILYEVINKIINFLHHNFDITAKGDCGYSLRKIYGPTRFHKDGIVVDREHEHVMSVHKIRCMSLIIALNDDYDEGEFCFPAQRHKVKLKKGQAIAFPPYWTHEHGVTCPKNGFRYTINTWLYE